ncbi:hypothetical protein [Neptunomonas sp. XY-337]|uniref:DUF6162 family protein n=1 Tax=Neptunomonas sp. XY-337 TaxID=2561897 RepID=UPI0010AA6448|nr:hypothetical protein [Neptunomonas sp. XY-337]
MSSDSPQLTIEVIAPDNGGRETLWVTLTIVLMVILAFIGIKLNRAAPAAQAQHIGLSIEAKRVLTDLRNAADEIQFSAEGTNYPSITELQRWALPPFAKTPGVISQYVWDKVEHDCYLGVSQQEGSPHFMLLLDGEPHIYWSTDTAPVTDCHQNLDWIKDKPRA